MFNRVPRFHYGAARIRENTSRLNEVFVLERPRVLRKNVFPGTFSILENFRTERERRRGRKATRGGLSNKTVL